ncbi:MBL fold metallo-hydrolase [Gottschalkiaceae bacterium SANA]|nr:MBL fold metallo-hydrolase [Gottschalkiaceae bacterium SANA]
MKLQFLGASQVVTGSMYLLTTETKKILIDCGMFQGSPELERLNERAFSFDPSTIDYLVLTHAHIDHSGRIPKLIKDGFAGRILTTKATYDLSKLMLLDSAHIQEADIQWENQKRARAGKPKREPLYTTTDAEQSLRHFEGFLYEQKIEVDDEVSLRFMDAGHILGSSVVELWVTEKGHTTKLAFSGDLGMPNRPLLRHYDKIEEADYIIVESTYGHTTHPPIEDASKRLIQIINDTVSKGGTVVIPSFAVSRTQELIYTLNQYYENGNMENFMKIPIYVDSPMAVSATEIYAQNASCFNEETRQLILSGDDPFQFENLFYVRDQAESQRLNTQEFPKVIISASGMCSAGRIRHHLKHTLWKAKNSVIFVGYQAEGTLGRKLKEGQSVVSILGESIKVQAQIHSIDGFSGHADQPTLLNWLRGFRKKPQRVFVVHGEAMQANALKEAIEKDLKWEVCIPDLGYETTLAEGAESTEGRWLDPVRKREILEKELYEVHAQFESLIQKTRQMLDDKTVKKDYEAIHSRLLELQQQLLDLNLILGK